MINNAIKIRIIQLGLMGWLSWCGATVGQADDWSTYRHDQRRSGTTSEELEFERMSLAWEWQSALPPISAWPDAARWDAYSKVEGLRSMRDYDSAFQPVVAGNALLVASNSDDSLHCFELDSGRKRWTFTASGPIRVAPTLVDGVAYFGADDGCVYAVALDSGALIWSRELRTAEAFINDGRLCSLQPVRTGVLLDPTQETLVAGVGVLPWQPSSLIALNRADGSVAWEQVLDGGWTIEGPMLLGDEHIISPQGRAPPQLFSRLDGEPVGALGGGGGTFALLTDDGEIMHGPGNKGGWLTGSKENSRESFTSYEQGVSMVVLDDFAYVLDVQGVTALNRSTQQPRWKVRLRRGEEMIAAGSHLIVGGDGYVAALNSDDGQLAWVHSVVGRARGLAVANSHLIASTDRGHMHVFRASDEPSPQPDEAVLTRVGYESREAEIERLPSSPPPAPTDWPMSGDPRYLERWVFAEPKWLSSEDQDIQSTIPSLVEAGHDLTLPDASRFVLVGEHHAWELTETIDCQVAADFRNVPHPSEAMTAIATVRIDRAQPWGGLISMSQDNGAYERGWILGFQNQQFGFAVNGLDGDPGLSWALSDRPFQPGQWYQVVGTYDGQTTRLYVNGRQAAEHTKQSGEIDYPERAGFQLGAYRDDDEHYYSQGRLHELALSDRAWSAEEIERLYAATCATLGDEFEREVQAVEAVTHRAPIEGKDDFPMSDLMMEFVAPGRVEIRWETPQPSVCRLRILEGDADVKVSDRVAVPTTEHFSCLINVNSRQSIRFCVEQQVAADQWIASASYQCDGHFDYTRPPLPPADEANPWADHVREWLTVVPLRHPRGIACVVQGDADTTIAEVLCRDANMDVILLTPEPVVDSLRKRLLAKRLYGRPISVRPLKDLEKIPSHSLNLVWLIHQDGWVSQPLDQVALEQRLAPGGFVVGERSVWGTIGRMRGHEMIAVEEQKQRTRDWGIYRKPKLEGAAPWTHMYGLPDNTAFAGETLGGAVFAEQLQVNWAGRPGPRYQSDRGNRKPSPLAASGRLYLQGHHRLIGMDAHNGTILWSKELPKMVRFNVPRDCSNWCCDLDDLFVAIENDCVRLDGTTGDVVQKYTALPFETRPMNWGFVARHGGLLVGSSVASGSSFTDYWGKEAWYDAKEGEPAKKVASDLLFALEPDSGHERWRYDRGLILNPTISLSDDRIVFVECRSETLSRRPSRRLDGDELWQNLYVVALDLRTGEPLWEVQAQPMPGVAAIYGVCTGEDYLLQTSNGGEFALYSLHLTNGKLRWRGKYGWEADHHGKHLSRPAVVGDKIYLRPLTLDRRNGQVLATRFPAGHQCGTYTCSANAVFLRAGNLAMWDGVSSDATRWDRMRPDCWISTIPAEGMLLAPEGGGGCSCGGWIETSVGFGVKRTP